ncbi:hypothetical protein H310_07745 [Aphanomyces invadans]|uniref:Uncharacterized protein n=1 Tax=Aphanomyces invadans TaxID=157072 RepID=A0A024TZT0_9STRA|nr:hypothetical protein H310_07745 [Aphanomyces invadans]ETV99680.1 hypothetical protein H310_07745 [Aphanomyces invadans]|eukprot:XP_008871456.1 hypothetical protein H310_07745 [Aphanomyces invadans]
MQSTRSSRCSFNEASPLPNFETQTQTLHRQRQQHMALDCAIASTLWKTLEPPALLLDANDTSKTSQLPPMEEVHDNHPFRGQTEGTDRYRGKKSGSATSPPPSWAESYNAPCFSREGGGTSRFGMRASNPQERFVAVSSALATVDLPSWRSEATQVDMVQGKLSCQSVRPRLHDIRVGYRNAHTTKSVLRQRRHPHRRQSAVFSGRDIGPIQCATQNKTLEENADVSASRAAAYPNTSWKLVRQHRPRTPPQQHAARPRSPRPQLQLATKTHDVPHNVGARWRTSTMPRRTDALTPRPVVHRDISTIAMEGIHQDQLVASAMRPNLDARSAPSWTMKGSFSG